MIINGFEWLLMVNNRGFPHDQWFYVWLISSIADVLFCEFWMFNSGKQWFNMVALVVIQPTSPQNAQTPLAQPALAGKDLSERSIFSKETIGRFLMISNGY